MNIKHKIIKLLFRGYQYFRTGNSKPQFSEQFSANTNLEQMRLDDLYSYKILDSSPEKIFDDLTILASEICQTPMAQISLIDKERLWNKSKVGVTTTELPREITFCNYTIGEKNLMIVADTLKDNRFVNNPLVRLFPKIRFYAGAPLISSNGYNLGSLCVLDNKPRILTDSQQRALKILAEQTVALLELHKISLVLQEANTELQTQVSFRTKAEVASKHASLHDALTDLPNRRFLEERLSYFFAQGEDKKFALLFLDLDKFKSINDEHGHLVGDEILKIVASRLRKSVRENDHISRMGGDEFVIIIDNHDRHAIDNVAQKILTTIQNPIQLNNRMYNISTSIGIACHPEHGNNSVALLGASDRALYIAKRAGKNQFAHSS